MIKLMHHNLFNNSINNTNGFSKKELEMINEIFNDDKRALNKLKYM